MRYIYVAHIAHKQGTWGEWRFSALAYKTHIAHSTYSKDPEESGANSRDIFGPRKMRWPASRRGRLPCKSVQLPRVTHVKVPPFSFTPKKELVQGFRDAGRPTYLLPQKRACTPYFLPQKGLEQGSAGPKRPAHYLLPQKGLFKVPRTRRPEDRFCVEAFAHSPEHAGKVRVVEGDHLRAVAHRVVPSNSSTLFLRSRPGEAQPQVHVRALVLLGLTLLSDKSEACVADHVTHVARDHRQPGFLWFVVVDHNKLAGASRHPAPGRPSRSNCLAAALGRCRGPRCCWTPSPPSSSLGRDRPRSRRCWSR